MPGSVNHLPPLPVAGSEEGFGTGSTGDASQIPCQAVEDFHLGFELMAGFQGAARALGIAAGIFRDLHHVPVDAVQVGGLFLAGGEDALNQLHDFLVAPGDPDQMVAHFSSHGDSVFRLVLRGEDQFAGVAGGLRASLGEIPHLLRHHGEALPRVSGPGGFHRGVESEEVGLEGDFIDGLDDAHGLVGGVLDFIDAFHHPLHGLGAFIHQQSGFFRLVVRLFGIVGVAADGL